MRVGGEGAEERLSTCPSHHRRGLGQQAGHPVRRLPSRGSCPVSCGLGRSCLLAQLVQISRGPRGKAGGLSTTESSPPARRGPSAHLTLAKKPGSQSGIPQTGLGASSWGSAGRAGRQQGGAAPAAPCSAPRSWRVWRPFHPRVCSSRALGRGGGATLAADTPASHSGPASMLFSSWLSVRSTQTWRKQRPGWAEMAGLPTSRLLGREGHGIRVPIGGSW